jgi:hypothetical protein
MQVMFDTKIIKQLEKEIDDYYENYTKTFGMVTNEVIDRTLGMNYIVKRLKEIIIEES